MKILPDGTIEISNKNTGQKKVVQAADLPNYGISYSDYEKELQAAKNVGVVGGIKTDPMQAISDAMQQGGSDFVNKGKTLDERTAIAQAIAKLGGVDKYRQVLPLSDLVTEKEGEGLKSSADLKSKLDLSLPNFLEDTPGGTGPLAQFIPGFLRSPAGREKVADVGEIKALYQQMISGKVVSDKETERV